MKVKSNALVKLMVPLTILAAVFIGVKSCSTGDVEKSAAHRRIGRS